MSKVLLVLGSLTVFFLILEGSSTIWVKISPPSYRNHSPPTSDEIWSFDHVKFHSEHATRTGDIARVIIAGNYQSKFPAMVQDPEDLKRRMEPVAYEPSLQGKYLYSGPFKVTPNLNDDFVIKGRFSGKVKYKAHYTTDASGMRKGYAGKKKNILFIGCSYTFGQGVNDEETFPYIVGKKTGYRTFNKGIPGSGPLTILKDLRELKLEYFRGIPPEDTTVILTLIPQHFERVINTASYLRSSDIRTDHPYLVVDGNELIVKTLGEDDPYRIKRPELVLARLNFPRALGFDYPVIDDADYRLFVRVIMEIEKEMKEIFPYIRNFAVALFPTGSEREKYKKLRSHLHEEKSLHLFDYSLLHGPMLFGDSFELSYDGHPTAAAYELYSDLIIFDLRKTFGH